MRRCTTSCQSLQVNVQETRRAKGAIDGYYCRTRAWRARGLLRSDRLHRLNRHMDTNVTIRTVTLDDNLAVFQADSGITAMHDPKAEYEETLAKALRIFYGFRAEASGAP